MVLSWEVPSEDGGSPITGYIIEKHDKEGVRWTRCNRQTVTDLTFKVTGLLESHIYEFRVAAENAVGVGEPSTSTVFYKALDPIFRPGPPQNPKVTDTTKSSVLLSWGKPVCDGGCEIQAYIVECCIATEPVVQPEAPDASASTTDVPAENWIICTPPTVNSHGVSEALESAAVTMKNPFVPPGSPHIEDIFNITHDGMTITWSAPETDGGTEIIGYIVEVCKAEEEEWKMVTPPTGLRVNKYEIPKLTEGQEYKIQVCALNKMGVGEPVVLSGTAKPEERMDPPQIYLDSELRKGITVKAGGSVRIYIPFKGRPTPEIKWTKDDGDLSEKAVVEKAVNFTQLSIDSSDRHDSGKYTLSLTNSSGSVSEFVSVKVLDTPGAPQNLVVKDIKKDSVTLVWDKPEHDGGSRIGGYLIEMQPKGTDKWGVAGNPKTCEGTVTGLTAGIEYLFRIIAYNEKGKSEPKALAAPVIANDMTIEPSIKMQFNTYNVLAGKDLKLEFPVLGRPKPKISWAKDGQALKVTSRVNYPKLLLMYPFSSFDLDVFHIDVVEPPANVRVTEVTKNSVSLTWQKPPFDGGSKITGYSVERREAPNGRWVKANFTNIIELGFTAYGLTQDESYEFRVYAKNAVGSVSNPSLIAGPVTCVDACGRLWIQFCIFMFC
uniref:Titin n=1 Tax=Xiphophorus maculatus TaxID=8083 RepID=A0A3B5Q3K3_XIPMA